MVLSQNCLQSEYTSHLKSLWKYRNGWFLWVYGIQYRRGVFTLFWTEIWVFGESLCMINFRYTVCYTYLWKCRVVYWRKIGLTLPPLVFNGGLITTSKGITRTNHKTGTDKPLTQSELEGDTRGWCSFELILGLLLIGTESGANLFDQSYGVVMQNQSEREFASSFVSKPLYPNWFLFSAPDGVPDDLALGDKTSTSCELMWKEVVNSHPDPDGAVKGYYIYYRMAGLNDSLDKLDVVGANTTSYIVEKLKKFTEYEFQIVAYNQYDEGNASEIFPCQTKEDGTYVA